MRDFILKQFVEPYFLFGIRWILLLSFALMVIWFGLIKKYSELSFRNAIKKRIFWLPSLILLILTVAMYLMLLYFPVSKDRFVLAIADFHPVSTDEIDESKKMKDRLIREIASRQQKYNVDIAVKSLGMIDCSTEDGIEVAKSLGRHNRAHVVICGEILTDNQEYFFDVVIVNLLTDIRGDFKIDTPKKSDRLTFKKIAISKIADFMTFMFGFAKYELKQYQEAIEIFKSIKDQQPASLFYLGVISDTLNNKEQAISYYDQAITLQPDFVEAWSNKGTILMELNRSEEALLADNKAIELQPNYANAWMNKGYVLINLKKFNEALVATNRGIELKPVNLPGAWLNKGGILESLNHYPEALDAVNTSINLKPDMAEAWVLKGIVLARLNRFNEAIICGNRAIELKPDWADAYYNLACIYALSNDKNNAIVNLETAIRLNARFREVLKTDADLISLRDNEDFKNLLK